MSWDNQGHSGWHPAPAPQAGWGPSQPHTQHTDYPSKGSWPQYSEYKPEGKGEKGSYGKGAPSKGAAPVEHRGVWEPAKGHSEWPTGKGAESWGRVSESWGKGQDSWGKGAEPAKGPESWGKGPETTKGTEYWGKGPEPTKGADSWGKGPEPSRGADYWGKGSEPTKGGDSWGKGPEPSKGAEYWGKGHEPTRVADSWGKGPESWGKGSEPLKGAESWGKEPDWGKGHATWPAKGPDHDPWAPPPAQWGKGYEKGDPWKVEGRDPWGKGHEVWGKGHQDQGKGIVPAQDSAPRESIVPVPQEGKGKGEDWGRGKGEDSWKGGKDRRKGEGKGHGKNGKDGRKGRRGNKVGMNAELALVKSFATDAIVPKSDCIQCHKCGTMDSSKFHNKVLERIQKGGRCRPPTCQMCHQVDMKERRQKFTFDPKCTICGEVRLHKFRQEDLDEAQHLKDESKLYCKKCIPLYQDKDFIKTAVPWMEWLEGIGTRKSKKRKTEAKPEEN